MVRDRNMATLECCIGSKLMYNFVVDEITKMYTNI